MDKKDIEKYLIIAALLILIYVSYLLIKPFITTLIASAILAYLAYPLYSKTAKLTKNKIFAATLITALIVIIILFPLIYVTNALVAESINIYNSEIVEKGIDIISQSIERSEYNEIIKASLNKFINYIQENASKFLMGIPSKIFHFLIIIYATFAFLLIGEDLIIKFKKMIPSKNKDKILKDIGYTTHSIVHGIFLTALLEFIIAFIVLKLIGSNLALILAIVIGLLAFIPLLGPAVVWVPYAIVEIIKHNYTNLVILIILGIVLFLIDSVLKAKIIGEKIKLHPVVILVGLFGGISLMGPIGIVAGPVILSILINIIESHYKETKNET